MDTKNLPVSLPVGNVYWSGEAALFNGRCDRCKQEKMVIGFDNSAGEYGPISVCEPCLENLIDELKRLAG